MAARSWGEGEVMGVTACGYRVCLGGDGNVIIGTGDNCTTYEYTENQLISHF